ncbi:MAG: ATP-binding cassette domain-containing protein [Peptococcaceae bacterium]|jgi:ABC-type lipoprotein export system ATPase subunit|nr:ATP-binding cassette domain-containing protein [Peptococcaceae bacterium]
MLNSITIFPGIDKDGAREPFERVILRPREIYAIVGNTGSGKSRFISDIEQIADSDTVTKRRVVVDGALDNGSIAFLGQSMRFVLDCTVEEFIRLHQRCYNGDERIAGCTARSVLEAANSIASERLYPGALLGSLSGGQSRALMIAGISVISNSRVVLIDEIENAGIDKSRALELLMSRDKLVMIVTHDPHTALIADKRIVIRNGAVKNVLDTTETERESYARLDAAYRLITNMQFKLRNGEELC